MFKFVFRVSWRYLRARRGFISVIGWFSLLGIALGVGTLIIVMSVMNGFHEDLVSRIVGMNGHISIKGREYALAEGSLRTDILKKYHKEVKLAVPVIEGQILASVDKYSTGVLAVGISKRDWKSRKFLSESLIEGDTKDLNNQGGIIIGKNLGYLLRVGVGDYINLISPRGVKTAFGIVPRIKSVRIIGIFDVGMYEYNNSYIFMPLGLAQKYFNLVGHYGTLELFLEDADKAPGLASRLRDDLGNKYRISDWINNSTTLAAALEVERNVMFLILALIIIVAAFNIVTSQIMLVREKNRSLAIMSTMGATRGEIVSIFLINGFLIGLVGTCIGIVLGVLVSSNIEEIRQLLQEWWQVRLFQEEVYYLSQLPSHLEYGDVVLVSLLTLFLSFISSLYPALRAGSINPVEVLRNE